MGTGSAYLGGHLSFGRGVGVDQTAFEERSRAWKTVMKDEELPPGRLTSARAGSVAVVLYRTEDRIHPLSDRCSHRGCPPSDGEVRGTVVVCRCHSSAFDLEDGTIVGGPATAPQPRFEVRIRDGNGQVRAG